MEKEGTNGAEAVGHEHKGTRGYWHGSAFNHWCQGGRGCPPLHRLGEFLRWSDGRARPSKHNRGHDSIALSSSPWTSSPLHVNSSISNPSPATKPPWEKPSTANSP